MKRQGRSEAIRNAAPESTASRPSPVQGWRPGIIQPVREHGRAGQSQVVDRGLRLASQGDTREAARYLKEALSTDADNAAAWNNLGVLYLENGAAGPALDCFRRAVQHDEQAPTAWLNLGWSLLQRGDVTAADRCLRRVLVSQPENRQAWEGLAEVERRRGAMDEAVVCWQKAGRAEMNLGTAWVMSADELLDGGDAEGAVACLHRALHEGERAGIWARLGYAHSRLDEHLAAIRSYRRALELDPERPGLHYNLAVTLLSQGRLRESRRHLEQAVRHDAGDADAWNHLGHVLGELGMDDRARKSFERALEADPGCHQAWNNLGVWYDRHGDGRAAAAGFTRAVALQPENDEYRLNRAMTLARLGESESARRDLEELCHRQPELAEMLRELEAFATLDPGSKQRPA